MWGALVGIDRAVMVARVEPGSTPSAWGYFTMPQLVQSVYSPAFIFSIRVEINQVPIFIIATLPYEMILSQQEDGVCQDYATDAVLLLA